jgi:hypothetical protein
VNGQTAKKVEASTAPPGQKNPGGGLSELTDWKDPTFESQEHAAKMIL